MKKNKKGYFFTLTVILILALVYLFFASHRDPGYSRQAQVSEQRLQEVNRIITLIEKDAETGLRIAAFRTIMALDANITQSGPIDNSKFDVIINELLIYGKINEHEQSYMKNHSIIDWEDKAKLMLQNLNLEAEFSGTTSSLTQTSPWTIIARYETTLNITDRFTKSNWNKTLNVTSRLPIEDFYDPLFSIHTGTKRKINKKPEGESISNLQGIINNEYYVASNNSPGFLQRFQTKSNNHIYVNIGIESLIDKTSPFIELKQRPIIDSLYFSQESYESCIVQGHLLAIGYNDTYGVDCQVPDS
jgi:hypothetical protein